MRIDLVAAARPNFMKIAPLYRRLIQESWVEPRIVHTGQHYDPDMSDVFFDDLAIPKPHVNLGVGSGTHAEQTGRVMIKYERLLAKEKPDLVIVAGDVNSTMAATLAAVKLGVRVAHLEAGLRSYNRTMPEEINRVVTDAVADILWTPSPDADENLIREGISLEKIHRVGNIMIDSLVMLSSKIKADNSYRKFGLKSGQFVLVTLHRPSNVDHKQSLKKLCDLLVSVSTTMAVVFPVHPRTKKNLKHFGLLHLLEGAQGICLTKPLSYIRFMNLVFNCRAAITDSGGIQEETTYLGIPCLTLRPDTERPITITHGTNRLCTLRTLEADLFQSFNEDGRKGCRIDLWDGKTADRIVAQLSDIT